MKRMQLSLTCMWICPTSLGPGKGGKPQRAQQDEGPSPSLPSQWHNTSQPSLADLAPLPLLGFFGFPEGCRMVFIFTTSLLHPSLLLPLWQARNNISFTTTEENLLTFHSLIINFWCLFPSCVSVKLGKEREATSFWLSAYLISLSCSYATAQHIIKKYFLHWSDCFQKQLVQKHSIKLRLCFIFEDTSPQCKFWLWKFPSNV